MKNIDEIIESLLSHDISKDEARKEFKKIFNNLLPKGMIEMNIREMATTSDTDTGLLGLEIPYQYDKIKHLKIDDKVLIIKKP